MFTLFILNKTKNNSLLAPLKLESIENLTFNDFGIRMNFKFFENLIDLSDEDLQMGNDNILQVESENENAN